VKYEVHQHPHSTVSNNNTTPRYDETAAKPPAKDVVFAKNVVIFIELSSFGWRG
jgi:hypothetical protein